MTEYEHEDEDLFGISQIPEEGLVDSLENSPIERPWRSLEEKIITEKCPLSDNLEIKSLKLKTIEVIKEKPEEIKPEELEDGEILSGQEG